MQRSGMNKEDWTNRMELLKTILIASVIVSFVLAFAASSPDAFVDRSLPKKIFFVISIVWVVMQIIALGITVFHATIGKKLYRLFAYETINYNDSDPIKKIEVTNEDITLFFDEGRIVHRENLKFRDYDIITKMRENFEKPTFYVWDGLIKKVVIPYSEDPQMKWTEYSVRKMKRRQ